MAFDVNTVINIALAEVGYLEKKSNSQLDSKTANAGYNNYTKYGKEMHEIYPSVMDFPAAWCDAFVDWCFYKAYGVANAKALLCGNFDDYTVASAQLYKNKGAWYTSPKIGDQVFFKNSSGICHTGLVYNVDNSFVYTVEGNTSAESGVVANGGAVARKKYYLWYGNIAGYGRPNYGTQTSASSSSSTSTSSTSTTGYSKTQFIKDVQAALGVTVDGIAGPQTLGATITVSASKNYRHAVVVPIQKYLNQIGYNCGTVDGWAGTKFTSAVKKYQSANGCVSDGEITAKNLTWKKLLGLA